MEKKTKRISFLASLTNRCNILYDCGCDHGLVIKEALENNYIKYAIASDVNEAPLNSAKKNLCNYIGRVSFYHGNGICCNYDNVDCILLAGMGGNLILEIISKYLDSYNVNKLKDTKFIIQANSKAFELRVQLGELGFHISDEYIIFDKGQFYEIVVCHFVGIKNDTYKREYYSKILLKKLEDDLKGGLNSDIVLYFNEQFRYINELNSKIDLKNKSKILFKKLVILNNILENNDME